MKRSYFIGIKVDCTDDSCKYHLFGTVKYAAVHALRCFLLSCPSSYTGTIPPDAPVWGLTVLCSALLDSKTTHIATSSLNPLIVTQPSAPYTSATVGLQNDEVSKGEGKYSHVVNVKQIQSNVMFPNSGNMTGVYSSV